MSEVKRYDMRGNTWPSEDGHLVSYKDYAELKAQRDSLAAIVQRVIDTGELARPENESLEAELCALAASDGQSSCDARPDFEALIMLISRGLADVEKGINGYHDPQIQAFWENYQYSKGICDEVQE